MQLHLVLADGAECALGQTHLALGDLNAGLGEGLAMSPVPTEPNRRPSSPALRAMVTEMPSSRALRASASASGGGLGLKLGATLLEGLQIGLGGRHGAAFGIRKLRP
jgi:hypothetical protein